jgi:hypothetical protein
VRSYKQLLASFIEVVTFLLASFGGYLKNIAPPDPVGASFPVGALSFLALILLMIIAAISRKGTSKKNNRPWILAGIVCFVAAVPSVFVYRNLLETHTYPQSQELSKRQIAASEAYLTPDALRYKQTNASITTEELVRSLPDGDVWTADGLANARTKLLAAYACVVLSICSAIFCLLEANMFSDTKGPTSPKAAPSAQS